MAGHAELAAVGCSAAVLPTLMGCLPRCPSVRLLVSGAQWHVHFATTLYSLGFIPTRFDPNVWIKRRDDGKGYDYISTYVDNFLIPAKEPKNTWINYKIYILSRTLPSQRTTWEQRILGAQGVNVYNRKTLY